MTSKTEKKTDVKLGEDEEGNLWISTLTMEIACTLLVAKQYTGALDPAKYRLIMTPETQALLLSELTADVFPAYKADIENGTLTKFLSMPVEITDKVNGWTIAWSGER